jgi:hypothetical protein
MPFSYYRRLSRRNQAIYQQSDVIHAVRLPDPAPLRAHVEALRRALAADDEALRTTGLAGARKEPQRAAVAAIADRLCRAMTDALGVPPVRLTVLAVRPHDAGGELHGLYTWGDGDPPEIKLWMRTAKQKRVVAFKTFLRTLLHELCHHLDVRYYRLPESFHTEGFYKRESSLFHQLVPSEPVQTTLAFEPAGDDEPRR